MARFATSLSFTLFTLVFLMLLYISQDWNNVFFEFLYESIYTPFVLGILGIISGFFGVKDKRIILLVLNLSLLLVFGLLYFVAIIGFQEP